VDLLARSFDLARPGVAPPLKIHTKCRFAAGFCLDPLGEIKPVSEEGGSKGREDKGESKIERE